MSDESFLDRVTSDLPRENLKPILDTLGLDVTHSEWLLLGLVHRSFCGTQWDNETQDQVRSVTGSLQVLGSSLLLLILHDHVYFEVGLRDPKRSSDFVATTKVPTMERLTDALNLRAHAFVGRSLVVDGEFETAAHSVALQFIGGLYLSDGYEPVLRLIRSVPPTLPEPVGPSLLATDFKTLLQEYADKTRHGPPRYEILGESGPQHAKVFNVRVIVGPRLSAEGRGRSKKEAGQASAREWFERHAPSALRCPPSTVAREPSGTIQMKRMPLRWQAQIGDLSALLDIPKDKISLLVEALTHRSFRAKCFDVPDYSALAQLGSAVLGVAITDLATCSLVEGRLGFPGRRFVRIISALLNQQSVAELSDTLGLPRLLLLGGSQSTSSPTPSMKSDVLQSVLASAYISSRPPSRIAALLPDRVRREAP